MFALYSLLHKYKEESRYFVLLLGGLMLGAGFLFGDGIITPAISVLSAVEGLKVATPMFADAIVPLTVVILAALFAIQHKGTGGVGRVFGPILLVWFAAIAALGVRQIVGHPEILKRLQPRLRLRLPAADGCVPGAPDARSAHAGGDGRRGDVCRSRPFRSAPHPHGLVRVRLSRAYS